MEYLDVADDDNSLDNQDNFTPENLDYNPEFILDNDLADQSTNPLKRGRGRPKLENRDFISDNTLEDHISNPIKRGRGRPKLENPEFISDINLDDQITESLIRGRGRPKNPEKKRSLAELKPTNCHQLKQEKYPCHICGYSFFTTSHREDHIVSVHTGKCGMCNKDVTESTPWEEGLEKTSVRNVECSCGNTVLIYSNTRHAKEGLNEEKRELKSKTKRIASYMMPIDCPHCGLTLSCRSSLYNHVNRQHLKMRNFKCSVCTKEFFTSTHLQCHTLSVHTRKCQNCQEFVMETEPWPESKDETQSRELVCKCGTSVVIVTKRGPKHGTEGSSKRTKSKVLSDIRYACETCGKMFLKKSNARSHTCVGSANDKPSSSETLTENAGKAAEYVLEPETLQQRVEGGNLLTEVGSQVVMYEGADGQSSSDVPSIQIMHEGTLVPAEHMVDEHGNVSFIIKQTSVGGL